MADTVLIWDVKLHPINQVWYRISLHISRTFTVRKRGQKKGCDLYEGQEYNVSQCAPIPENWAMFMGATYMRVRPICEDVQ